MTRRAGGVDDPIWSASGAARRPWTRHRRARWTLRAVLGVVVPMALLVALLPGGSLDLPPSVRLGPPGHRFSLSFPAGRHERTITYRQPVRLEQYGTAIVKRMIWQGATSAAVDVSVWLDQLGNVPPAHRRDPFLRSYLPTTHGGRIVRVFGLPAAVEAVPCEPTTGRTCAGTLSELVVLDGTTLYSVLTEGPGPTDAAVQATFRP